MHPLLFSGASGSPEACRALDMTFVLIAISQQRQAQTQTPGVEEWKNDVLVILQEHVHHCIHSITWKSECLLRFFSYNLRGTLLNLSLHVLCVVLRTTF